MLITQKELTSHDAWHAVRWFIADQLSFLSAKTSNFKLHFGFLALSFRDFHLAFVRGIIKNAKIFGSFQELFVSLQASNNKFNPLLYGVGFTVIIVFLYLGYYFLKKEFK